MKLLRYTALGLCMTILAFSSKTLHAQDLNNSSVIDSSGMAGSPSSESLSTAYDNLYWINDTIAYHYLPTQRFGFVRNAVDNFLHQPKELVRRENLKVLTLVAITSAICFYYDQEIVDAAQQFGRYIGLSGENNTYNLTGNKKLRINVPTDLSSGLYYIGDGITELAVNAGFYIYGLAKNDRRALQTAAQLAEGMISVGSWVQILKHLTGHESPEYASVPGGRWRFFPSPIDYHKTVPKYDAFPSGHLATAMMTTTVISMNYPEYKWIKPLCFTLMGLCGYQMLNNGVHWMGDYPFALALGYSVGKYAFERGHVVVNKNQLSSTTHQPSFSYRIHPTYLAPGTSGLALTVSF